MSTEISTTVGPQHVADGSIVDLRLGKDRQLITDQLHGKMYEAASRGAMYSATQASTGVAPGTAFSTTPPMQLWNPPNSGFLLLIRRVVVGFKSGTLGAGVIGYGINASQQTAPSSATAITSIQMNGSASASSAGQANTGGTISAAAKCVMLGPTIGTTPTTPVLALVADNIEGGIIVPQGAVFTVEAFAAAAGTSPLTIMSIVWEEVSAA